MLKIRRILVAIRDMQHTPLTALRKVAVLARATGARIELLHVMDVSPSPLQAVARARQRLERIARSAWARGCRIECTVIDDSPAHEAIVRGALASKADLVVAPSHAHGRAARWFLRNTDWELIRHCPCPLLLAKSRTVYRKPVILVAVDPFHAHSKPAGLDLRLLAAGKDWARLLGGSVHLFHAYMPLPAYVEGTLGEPVLWENPEVENIHGAQVRSVFNKLARRAGIPAARRHLVMGDAAGELPSMVRRVRAALVVMGTISRSGPERVFIGSTAERALDRLTCDVLTVKPRGLKSKARRRRRSGG
jgi:universal stress protein E